MMICSTCVHAGTYHSRLIIQQQQNQPPNSEMARSTQGDRGATHRKADERQDKSSAHPHQQKQQRHAGGV